MREYRKFLEKMGFSKPCIEDLCEYKISQKEYEEYKKAFLEEEEIFLKNLDKNKEKLALYLYTSFALDLKEEIKKDIKVYTLDKGFDVEKIYYDTISDIRIWQEVYQRRSADTGLIELAWVANSIKGRIYRLGRLQFEADKNKKIIHIHIPEGERLQIEECENSLSMARQFFENYEYFDCLSWLLSPKILDLVGKDSGIRSFQSLFEIKEIRYDMKQATQRVLEDAPSKKETSLQKKLRQYLKTNTDPGMGYGIIKF